MTIWYTFYGSATIDRHITDINCCPLPYSSDPFLYMAISSVMEIVGYTWILWQLSWFGRRTVLAFNFAGCAIAMVSILLIPKGN